MYDRELPDVLDIIFIKYKGEFSCDTALVGTEEDTISVDQCDKRITVLAAHVAAVTLVHAEFGKCVLYMFCHFIISEYTEVRGVDSLHFCKYSHIQGLTSRKHFREMKVHITYIITDADKPHNKPPLWNLLYILVL